MKTWIVPSLAVVVVAGISSLASANTATTDGKFDGVGTYDHFWSVAPASTSPDKLAMTNAKLYMTQGIGDGSGNGNLYIALVLPRNYVDNTYSTSAFGSTGIVSSGWGSHLHTFSELDGSDQSTWALKHNGTTFFGGDMDYVEPTGSGNTTTVGSLGFTGGEGGITAGNSGMVAAAQSSMGYNWSKFGYNMLDKNHDGDTLDAGESDKGFNIVDHSPAINTTTYAVTDSDFADWQFDVVYEFEITAAALGNVSVLGAGNTTTNGFGLSLTFVHASPNMFGSNSDGYAIDITPSSVVVPLHPAVWMGGLMMSMLAGVHLIRRRRAAVAL